MKIRNGNLCRVPSTNIYESSNWNRVFDMHRLQAKEIGRLGRETANTEGATISNKEEVL